MKKSVFLLLPFLCLPLVSFAQDREPVIFYSNGKFSAQYLQEPTQHPKASRDAYWRYFWEFGDGHYSFEETPTHYYEKRGNYPVRLHLTAYYAVEGYKILAGSTGPAAVTGDTPGRYADEPLFIRTNVNTGGNSDDVVPGQAYDVVLHYSPREKMKAEGYLILFYNKLEGQPEGPFEVRELRPYAHFAKQLDERTVFQSSSLPSRLRQLNNEHKNALVFRTDKLDQGEEHRLFLTLGVSRALAKLRDKNQKYHFTACWLPDGLVADGRIFERSHEVEIQSIHDPNRLRVRPRIAYFKKNRPVSFDYSLRFQNESEGTVDKARVVVKMEKGVELRTLTIHGTDMRDYPECTGDFSKPCYEVKRPYHPAQDSFEVVFHHIGLEGKSSKGWFDSKKTTQAQLNWSMSGSRQREAVTMAQAKVYFEEVKPVATPIERIRWRMKSFYVRGGLGLLERSNTYTAGGPGMSFGMGFQNAALGIGWSRGWDVGISRFSFRRDSLAELPPSNLLANGGYLFSEEIYDLNVLDARYSMGFQPTGFLRVFGSAGIAVPAWGKVELHGWVSDNPAGDGKVLEDAQVLEFGLWRSNDPVPYFNQRVSAPSMLPGFSGQIGVEVGALSDIWGGVAYEYRRLHKTYSGDCMNISNFTIYLKLRLAAL